MTDNYNDDYREVIPEEEKTETTLNENRDNEKNSENTQVADTAGENSAEKKTEDKKDSSEYEDVCFAEDRRAKPAECSSCLIISAFAMTACTRPWRL